MQGKLPEVDNPKLDGKQAPFATDRRYLLRCCFIPYPNSHIMLSEDFRGALPTQHKR